MILSVNLLIMLGWAAVSGDFGSANMLAGFVVGFAALWITRDLFGASRYHARVIATARLVLVFLRELAMSSLDVALAVLNPRRVRAPGFVTMPLDARTDAEIMMTANLISLTPGTLSITVSPDRATLTVHAMFAEEPDDVIDAMKTRIERPVLEALR